MQDKDINKEAIKAVVKVSRYAICIAVLAVACLALSIFSLMPHKASAGRLLQANATAVAPQAGADTNPAKATQTGRSIPANAWVAPDTATIPAGKAGQMIRYGRELIAHTSKYFGPNGTIAHLSNSLNCQNCHLDAGTRYYGNNFGSFWATYPKVSSRSGKVQPPSQRIVDCFERSLAGTAPDTNGKEVKAMLAYMKWVGQATPKGQKAVGAGNQKLPYLNRAASPALGKAVFVAKCQSCHGTKGEGTLNADKLTYLYPPLWGTQSYNDGAGMYRLGNLAGFVKNNMPYGATYQTPQLTDEEAWDVAAFIDSQPRPHKNPTGDYPDLNKKPIDSPFGPFADSFTANEHKYGPFGPIKAAHNK